MTKQNLAEAINSFADAKATGNQNLIRFAIGELNAIMQQVPDEFGTPQPPQVTQPCEPPQ